MNTEAWLDELESRAEERYARPRSPRALSILYDPGCALCRSCVRWLQHQTSYVPLSFVPCTGEEARERYGDIPWLGDELVVVGDEGEVWVGPAAFLTCLWALEEYRDWSYRFAGPAFAPLAERFLLLISKQRRALSFLFAPTCDDGTCSLR